MLWSRTAETSAIDRLLSRARTGHGGGLLLRGEPGIGKSALLRYAGEHAADLCVLQAAGAVAESDLAYAAIHQLLGRLLPRAGGLPEPQAAALRIALGLQAGPDAPDPFLVSLAVLTLLSDAGRPVLCLVDDVQWMDGPSVGVLAFVIRRLRQEPVVVLAAARPDPGRADSHRRTGSDLAQAGLPERILGGLDPGEASRLLTELCGATLPPAVRDSLLAAAAGNPLALIELPGTLSPAQLAGTEPLPEPLPLAGELERVFAARVSQLEPGQRTLALLSACSGRLPAIKAAAAALGVGADGLDRLHGLVRITDSAVVFTHPLIRSAAYYQASPAERRAAHAALADREEADRRAWHLARAASGPDERAAAELERSAARTLRRSGYGAAAAAFERAAELSPADADQARRLAAAADAAWHGADTARVRALLEAAEQLPPPEPAVRLRLQHIRGLIELRSGVPADGLAILLPAAAEAVKTDPHLAVAMLAEAGECAFQAGDEGAALEIAALLAALPGGGDPRDALVAGLYRSVGPVPRGEAPGPTGPDLGALTELDDPDLLARAGGMLHGLGQHALARRLRVKAVARARALGAAGTLAWALRSLALDEIDYGRFAWAGAYAAEGLQLAIEAGQPNLACQHRAFLAEIAAARGPEDEARRLGNEVLAEATGRGLRGTVALARRALVQLALATGRPDEALVQLEAMWTLGAVVHRGLAQASVPDLVEAAVRAGRPELGAERLPGYLSWAQAAGSAEAGALAARSRALLAGPEEADALFEESLRLHAATDRPMQQARTALLYGEQLRRHRRRVDARGYLNLAADAFGRLGACRWAQRARDELRATGETVRRTDDAGPAIDRLTHQELQVARAVSQGLTNREAAAQLFISPRTVDHHLRSIYRKFGITSRAELVLLAGQLTGS
jgi:DNA-binding CsgD family transcriptional regulator